MSHDALLGGLNFTFLRVCMADECVLVWVRWCSLSIHVVIQW